MQAYLSRLSNREKGLLYLAVTLVGLALWYSYLLGPTMDRWQALRSEGALKELQYQKYVRIAGRHGETMEQYSQFADRLRMEGSEEEEMAILLKDIEGLARGRVRITNIKPYSVTDLDFYKRFSVELECETTMESLVGFIYEVELARPMLRLRSLRIQAKGASDMLDVSLSLSKVGLI